MNFHRPGISDEFLQAAGVHLVEEPEPCLRIPYHDREGKQTGHFRERLFKVRTNGQKYDQAPGSGIHVYFSHLRLEKPCPLFVMIEGEFKHLALREDDFQGCGLPCLHCYSKDNNGHPQILPELYEAIRFAEPENIVFVSDNDAVTNLEFFRSAHFLATTFPQIPVSLVQLPLNGPKGADDLREELNSQFPARMAEELKRKLRVDPERSFLVPALLQLEANTELIHQLPAESRERHIERIIQMTSYARIAKDEPCGVIERFFQIAHQASGMTKPAFEKSVEDEITRICPKPDPDPQENSPRGLGEIIKPWPEPVDGEELLGSLAVLFKRFTVLEKDDDYLQALWTVETYLTDCFDTLVILRVRSPEKRCGKSTLLDLLELLVWNPLLCVTVTPASLYRIIEHSHPTILIDEADSFGNENDDLRAIVNAGYERGRLVPRCNSETNTIEFFNTFGCKCLTSIGALHETIEDRSITIFMNRKRREEEIESLCDVQRTTFLEFRRKIVRWANDHRTEIKELHLVRPKALFDRNWKIWRPLISIAAITGETPLVRTLRIAIRKSHETEDEPTSIRIEILVRLRDLFQQRKAEFLPTTDILRYLNADQEALWADWVTGLKKGLTAERLGRELRFFKVRSDKPQFSGVRQAGYWLKDLQPHFDAYLSPQPPPSSPPPGQTVSSEAFSRENPPNNPDNPDTVSQVVENKEVNPVRVDPDNPDSVRVEQTNPDRVNTLEEKDLQNSVRVEPLKKGESAQKIPPSTPWATFRNATAPAHLVYLDIETFYPWPSAGDYLQPELSSPGLLARKERRQEAHPYAKDPRRCALRFLTIYYPKKFGPEPISIDIFANPQVASIGLHVTRTATLVGHNLDFDLPSSAGTVSRFPHPSSTR